MDQSNNDDEANTETGGSDGQPQDQSALEPVDVSMPNATAQVVPPARFCRACGAELVSQAVICPKCGSAVGGPMKDKTIAVLLAVFLSFWTWVYTYQKDKTKFWVGLGLGILGTILSLILIGYVLVFAIWIWAIVDVARKPQSWYSDYSSTP